MITGNVVEYVNGLVNLGTLLGLFLSIFLVLLIIYTYARQLKKKQYYWFGTLIVTSTIIGYFSVFVFGAYWIYELLTPFIFRIKEKRKLAKEAKKKGKKRK